MEPMQPCRLQFQVEDEWIDTVVANHVGCVPGLVRLSGTAEENDLFHRCKIEKRPMRIFSPTLQRPVDGWHINWVSFWWYPWLYERGVQLGGPQAPIDWQELERQYVIRPEHDSKTLSQLEEEEVEQKPQHRFFLNMSPSSTLEISIEKPPQP